MTTPHHSHTFHPRPARWLPLALAALASSTLPLDAGDGASVRTTRRTASCALNPDPENVEVRPFQKGYADLRECVGALEGLRRKVEEWGTVTISAPVVVLDMKAFAVPDEILTPKEMYAAVSAERAAAVFQSNETSVNNQFAATATPTALPGFAKAPAGGTATTTSTTTSTATAPATAPALYDSTGKLRSSLDAESLALPAAASQPAFGTLPASFTLPGFTAPTGSVADAMQRTNNNLVQQKIFSQLTQPKSLEGQNHVLFCLVQVSCNPGWRTKENYVADCSASLEYYDLDCKKHLSGAVQRAPQVFSVLPLLDAQTVEMGNSQREITQLAFQLAASLPARGVDIKAKNLFEFVHRFARDMRSVTPIPVVNSYSSGSTFGFRFSPSFQALRDPAQKNAKAANVLLPRSFPALVTVVFQDEDMPVVVRDLRGVALQFENGVPVLPRGLGVITHVSTRWNLKDHPPAWKVATRLFTPMRRDTAGFEVGMAEDLASFYAAKRRLRDYAGADRDHFSPIYEELRREVIDLESKGLGRDWPIPLQPHFFANAEKVATAATAKYQESEKVKSLQTEKKVLQDTIQTMKDTEFDRLKAENEHLKSLIESAAKSGKAGADGGTPEKAIGAAPARPAPIAETPVPAPATASSAPVEELSFEDTLPLLPREFNSDATSSLEPPLPTRGASPAPRVRTTVKAPAAPVPAVAEKPAPPVRKTLLALGGKH